MKLITVQNYLKQPYPYFYELRNVLHLSVLIFLMTLFFNYFFEPFGVNKKELKMDFFWISSIHASVSVIIIFLGSILLLFKKELMNKWTIKKEGIFIWFTILLIGIGQFLVRDIIYDNPNNWSWHYFFKEIRNTFLVGILFLIIIIPLIHNRYLKQHQKTAKSISLEGKNLSDNINEKITIITTLKSDNFSLNPHLFLFAVSEGNYTEVYFLGQDDKPQKKLLRISLKQFNEQLTGFSFIMRTHRSFVVNLNRITAIEGNAQGLKLSFSGDVKKALVSRKMVADFKRALQYFQS